MPINPASGIARAKEIMRNRTFGDAPNTIKSIANLLSVHRPYAMTIEKNTADMNSKCTDLLSVLDSKCQIEVIGV